MCTPAPTDTNALLRAAPRHVRGALRDAAAREFLVAGQLLHDAGTESGSVWFPLSGAVSVTACSPGGATAAGLIGREGAVGTSALGAGASARLRFEVLCPGECLVVPVRALAEQLERSPGWRRTLYAYHATALASVLAGSRCQRDHLPSARVARRLLELLDLGIPPDEGVPLDELTRSLCASSSEVVTAASLLGRTAAVAVRDGRLFGRSRADLLAFACRCYPRDARA